MSKAHIANHFLQASIGGAERQGYTAEALFQEADIAIGKLNQPGQLITEAELTRLIKVVWRNTRDEFMGLSPHVCRNGVFALMADYCLSSITLGAMLERSARFYSAVCEDIDIELEEVDESHDGQVFFRLQLLDSQYDPDHLLQEFLLLMWQRFSCWLVDQQIPITTTTFSYPAPDHVEEYKVLYPGGCRFNQSDCGFYLHTKYLQLPIVKSQSDLELFLKESPAYILHRPGQDESLQAKIRMLLSAYDYTAMPGLEDVSRELHLTPRTIARKLKDEGNSFSRIKETLRREFAIRLLTTEHLSIAEVSERTGFSEAASFCRAFKRWTGRSPAAWGRVRKMNGGIL